MKKPNDWIAGGAHVRAAPVRIFWPSSRFIMSLRVSSDSVSMPSASIQQPACLSRWTKAGSVRLSARALPNHWIGSLRAISSSQKALNVLTFSVTVSPHR